jgi:hypothetical protein
MSSEERSFSWITIVVACCIPVIAIAAYVYIGHRPPVHSGQVLSVNVYPIHRDLRTRSSTEGVGGQSDVFDEVIVLTDVRIKNTSKDLPLYLHDMAAVVSLPDGDQRSTDVSPSDFDKVFLAYPELKPLRKDAMPRDITLGPGQQREGMMIFNYQISKAQWDQRSRFDIEVSFINQKPLIINAGKS